MPQASTCQVCDVDLEAICAKRYCCRRRVCNEHLQALEVTLPGNPDKHRFCFQCGKFHPLSCFDGKRRSCRERLLQRYRQPSGGSTCRIADSEDGNGDTTQERRNAAVACDAAAAAAPSSSCWLVAPGRHMAGGPPCTLKSTADASASPSSCVCDPLGPGSSLQQERPHHAMAPAGPSAMDPQQPISSLSVSRLQPAVIVSDELLDEALEAMMQSDRCGQHNWQQPRIIPQQLTGGEAVFLPCEGVTRVTAVPGCDDTPNASCPSLATALPTAALAAGAVPINRTVCANNEQTGQPVSGSASAGQHMMGGSPPTPGGCQPTSQQGAGTPWQAAADHDKPARRSQLLLPMSGTEELLPEEWLLQQRSSSTRVSSTGFPHIPGPARATPARLSSSVVLAADTAGVSIHCGPSSAAQLFMAPCSMMSPTQASTAWLQNRVNQQQRPARAASDGPGLSHQQLTSPRQVVAGGGVSLPDLPPVQLQQQLCSVLETAGRPVLSSSRSLPAELERLWAQACAALSELRELQQLVDRTQ